MQEQDEVWDDFYDAMAALEALENAPCIDGVYVLDNDLRLTPGAREAAMWDIDQQLQAMVHTELKEGVARGEYVRHPDGKRYGLITRKGVLRRVN